jgi:nucleoside-diphosphate-sugar epimerase
VKVLVTGASGFLGSHIAETLVVAGHEVRLLLRRTSSREFLRVPFEEVIGDVAEAASLEPAVAGVDAVVHAAGLVKARSETEFAQVNELGTASLAAAAERAAPTLERFIYVSSLSARGPGDGSADTGPVSAYGRTKLAGEIALRRTRLADRTCIFRMPVIYGPRDPALVPLFRGARLRVAPLLNGGRNLISIVYVADAASAIVGALESGAATGGKTYSPEDGVAHSWRDVLGAVETAVGHNVFALPVPSITYSAAALATRGFARIANRAVIFTPDKVREMVQARWVCSAAELREDVGWEPRVSLGEGARLTFDWYRAHGWA